MLTPDEKRELLRIARDAIAVAMQRTRTESRQVQGPGLLKPGGAFVTLTLDGNLRGCIGYIESDNPLASVVAEVAVKAAYDDPRFPALTPQEFENVRIEVSVLSPLRTISSVDEIHVGVHGLLMQSHQARGLLLPQVAVQYRWDRETFLQNTARKAGLPRDAWKDPATTIYIFTAEVFGENGE